MDLGKVLGHRLAILCGSDQARAKAASLSRWINREQAEVGAADAWFNIDTCTDVVAIVRGIPSNQELAGRH